MPPRASSLRAMTTGRLGLVRAAGAVFVLNVALRGVFVALTHGPQRSDFAFYLRSARLLAEGRGYQLQGHPTAFWPVGWPLFLSAVFRVFGSTVTVGLTAQVLLMSAVAVMILLTGARAFGLRAGTVAALAWTLLPSTWTWTAVVGTEPLFTLLCVSALYFALRLEGWRRAVVVGVVVGAACWVRPTVIFFPLALGVADAAISRRLVRPLAMTAATTMAMLLTIAPLTIWNDVRFHELIPVSTNGGQELWQGTRTDGGYYWPKTTARNPLLTDTGEAQDAAGRHLFFEYVTHQPARFVTHIPIKWVNLYRSDASGWGWLRGSHGGLASWVRLPRAISTWLYRALMALAVFGAVRGWRRARAPTVVLGAFVVYYTAVFSVFPVSDRFRFPMMPVFAMFAGVALVAVFDTYATTRKISSRQVSPRATLRRPSDLSDSMPCMIAAFWMSSVERRSMISRSISSLSNITSWSANRPR